MKGTSTLLFVAALLLSNPALAHHGELCLDGHTAVVREHHGEEGDHVHCEEEFILGQATRQAQYGKPSQPPTSVSLESERRALLGLVAKAKAVGEKIDRPALLEVAETVLYHVARRLPKLEEQLVVVKRQEEAKATEIKERRARILDQASKILKPVKK